MTPGEVRSAFEALLDAAPKVTSLSAFDAAVNDRAEAWRKQNGTKPKLWFRGHRDYQWHLTPPALRSNQSVDPERDQHFFVDFKRRGLGLVQPRPETQWAWLYVAQHHGFPTRLLDWSEGSHAALFFAVGEGPLEDLRERDACVWLLNAAALNVRYWKFNYVVTMVDDVPQSDVLLAPYRIGKPIPSDTPPLLAVIPEYITPRIRAQRGAFVAFADDGLALARMVVEEKDNATPICTPIVIDRHCLDELEGQLIDAGAGHSAFFPDTTGLCEELARRRHHRKL
jgi:FRG domain